MGSGKHHFYLRYPAGSFLFEDLYFLYFKKFLFDFKDSSYMRKFNRELKHISFSNGGSISFQGIIYHFCNTCSIDYFLLTIYLICSTSDTSNERLNRNENQNSTALNLAFKNITNHLKKNDWTSARFEWAKTTNMRFFTNSDNSITYDFFLNLEESFGNIMHVYQTFIFDYHCCKDKCSVNGIKKQQLSSSFTQM